MEIGACAIKVQLHLVLVIDVTELAIVASYDNS